MIRLVLAAAAVLALGAPALAQSQAGPAAAPAGAPAAPAKEQTALMKTLDAMASGQPNFDDMETPLADAVRGQSAAMAGLWSRLGARQGVVYVGEQQGLHRFDATYANGKLAWIIGLTPAGKIHTLAAQPAQ